METKVGKRKTRGLFETFHSSCNYGFLLIYNLDPRVILAPCQRSGRQIITSRRVEGGSNMIVFAFAAGRLVCDAT